MRTLKKFSILTSHFFPLHFSCHFYLMKKNIGEIEHEKILLHAMENENFQYAECEAFTWIKTYFGGNITHPYLQNICRGLSERYDIPIGREYYRRKETCWYWLHKNFEIIKRKLTVKIKIIFENGEIIIPPFTCSEQ